MKKTIAIILLVCLTVGMAFAAKSSFKFGLQAGYTSSIISMKVGDEDSHFDLYGFYVAATGELPISDKVSIKAEFGAEFLKEDLTIGPVSFKDFSDPAVHLTAFIGPDFCFELSKNFCLDTAIGINILSGREDKDSEKTYNFALGIGAEVTAFFEIATDFEIGVGGKFAWHFVNTSKYYKDLEEDEISNLRNIAFQINGAVRYSF